MLRPEQVYEFLRGKTKGTCSRKCGAQAYEGRMYSGVKYTPNTPKPCSVCGNLFTRKEPNQTRMAQTCGSKCSAVLSSRRMKENNPAKMDGVIEKVSASLRRIGHKPYVRGGNGKPATEAQLRMYNELSKHDDSFEMEVIEKTGRLRHQFGSPNHYKIDIASRRLMIAIEVDGHAHAAKKIQECDQRKEQLLALRGWTVLRFTNFQIQSELQNCVQKVLSMISP